MLRRNSLNQTFKKSIFSKLQLRVDRPHKVSVHFHVRVNPFEEFDTYEPLRTPFECERCDFFTTDAVTAAEHLNCHNDLATEDISRWEPPVSPVQISVIVPNPNF